MMRLGNRKSEKGFSLAEAMLATVVLSVAASGILLPFSSGAELRRQGSVRTKAALLASGLMEEVAACSYGNIVSGYNYTEAAGGVRSVTGRVYGAGYEKLSRKVESSYCYVDSQAHELCGPVFIKVTVTVYYDGKEVATVSRLVSSGLR